MWVIDHRSAPHTRDGYRWLVPAPGQEGMIDWPGTGRLC
jgi:hypothetical protein